MNPHRRRLLAAGLTGLAGVAAFGAWRAWPDEGLFNPCAGALPPELANHGVVRDAWAGLDAAQVVDAHVHLLGVGDAIHSPMPPHVDGLPLHDVFTSNAGFNAAEGTWRWPLAQGQRAFFLNAACVNAPGIDRAYAARLRTLADDFQAGARVLLLALDGFHDEAGRAGPARTHVWVGNDYCAAVAKAAPERFLWAASLHPYRSDAVAELARVQAQGARAVKWIPSAQGIDPASPKCDAFYAALAKFDLPLVTHAGTERAAPGDDELGNPLKLRRALEHGVRVVVAHCASMGEGRDLDAGANGPAVSNFRLFERLMDEPKSAGKLFGDLSALSQRARAGALRRVIERGATDWAGRLLNGSDYPLPGIMPLFSTRGLAETGLIATSAVEPLVKIRRHNPMLYDFVLKRQLRSGDRALPTATFATRRFFEQTGRTGI
jgi:predicted TIM-barrel fold metal-dependent hydrolase